MKKYLIITIVIMTFLNCCKTNEVNKMINEPIKLEINENSTIVCFGDSLTYGHGAEIEESYPMILQKYVIIPVVNSGINDDTTADGLKRIQEDVIDHNPVIVLIQFGGNDMYNSKPRLKIKETENNFRQMIDLLDNGNREIYILRYFNNQMRMFDLFFSFDRMLDRIKKDYPNIRIIYNIWEGVWGKKDCKYDFTHPNNRGYEIIADNIFNEIRDVLEYNVLVK